MLEDVPAVLPFGEACAGVGCGLVRRSRPVPAAAGLDAATLVAAVMLLGRKYGDAVGFAVGVRSAAWSEQRLVGGALRSDRTVGEHLRTVADALRHAAPSAVRPHLVCLLDGPAGAPDGADLVVSADGGELHVDTHVHVHDVTFADRMLGHLEMLLEQFAEPERSIGELGLLTPAEHAEQVRLNQTARPYPRDLGLYEQFAAHVAARPDHVAVRTPDEEVTYRELDERAARLAGALTAAGVRPGDRVAYSLGKTPWLVVAALAVVRAGAAYVPVEPGLPERRRDLLITDTEAAVLLTDAPATAPVPVLDVTAGCAGEVPPPAATTGTDLAYIMHTSGSTGTPKGVLINQRAVTRLVRGIDWADLSSASVLLQTGAIGFDATTFEFWGTLLNGATLVMVPPPTLLSAADLGVALLRFRVDTLFLTTALFNQLIDQDPTIFGECHVLTGGERASARHFAAAMAGSPRATFSHVYGPTENTVFSTAYPVTRVHHGRVPIGRPIANSTAWVLDRDGNPQPVGVPGEIHVGGDGLADGYLNRPELTARTFVTTTERLYRTGDIGCWTNSGHLHHLGRRDDQVKVRGFRVELGEVEHHLGKLTRECAVLMRDDALHAYVTADVRLRAGDLRAALLAELPEYMVPATFHQLDTMPVNRNHKIDRAALAALPPTEPPAEPEQDPEPAGETRVTAAVTTIFAEVLGLPSVSLEDNFYALGGHSLRAMRLWNRLRDELGVDIGLALILDASTVGDVVTAVAGSAQAEVRPRTRPKLVRRS